MSIGLLKKYHTFLYFFIFNKNIVIFLTIFALGLFTKYLQDFNHFFAKNML